MGLPVDIEEHRTAGVMRWRRNDRGVALLILCHLALGSISLICVALVFAFATNLLRSLFLTAWSYRYGSESMENSVHDISGYAVLGLTVIGLTIVVPYLNPRSSAKLTA